MGDHAQIIHDHKVQPISFVQQMLYAGFAGFVETSIMYPLDFIKTKMMMDTSQSLQHLAYSIYNEHGIIGFYKGVQYALMTAIPWRAIKIATFSWVSTRYGLFTGAVITAIIEAFLLNPFEKIKVLAVQHHAKPEPLGSTDAKPSSLERLFQKDDLFSIWKPYEIGVLTMRQCVFNIIYFSVYQSMRHYMPSFFAGWFAGAMAVVGNHPIDTIKTRIQSNTPLSPDIQQFGLFPTLYAGFFPKFVRLSIGSGIIFACINVFMYF